ncbi:MAG: hypothetical protein FJ144_17540 [Deltaproteobacteria bacterium]|nr:hypothetical protein [Deltaproteobacteria bacterium]
MTLLVLLLLALAWSLVPGRLPPPPREAFSGAKFAAGKRESPDLTALPGESPFAPAYETRPLFPKLAFEAPVLARQTPQGPDERLFVLEQKGELWAIAQGGSSRELVLDVSDRVYFRGEAGAIGFAFHPDFGTPGSGRTDFYLFYSIVRDDVVWDRVSRFEWRDGRFDPASETLLIEQRHDWHEGEKFTEHFGGTLVFGPDGYLYVGFGDEGWIPERLNPQRIDLDFFSGILRIDVDCQTGRSHPPPRDPVTGKTQGYCIPDDNPFVGAPNVLEEFWAIGLRNPYRFSFDAQTDELWISDVGGQLAEEVNLGVAGGNYQWSYREGNEVYRQSYLRGEPPKPYPGSEQKPLFTYPHGTGNGCVIGGHVYRGRDLPELSGRYVFGDRNSGRVWALQRNERGGPVDVAALAQVPSFALHSFAELRSREVLLIGPPPVGISNLVATTDRAPAPLPRLLSETKLFADLATLTPARGIVPYDINVPFWSDGARKRRWIAVPGDGRSKSRFKSERIVWRPSGPWGFPAGTTFVKHFELPIDAADPSRVRRLETRVLVLTRGGGAYGVTYRWNEAQTDAELLEAGLEEKVTVRAQDGSTVEETWTYPSPSDCLTCHNPSAGSVLGVQTKQIKREASYPGVARPLEQLEAWDRARLFTAANGSLVPIPDGALERAPALVPTGDGAQPVPPRARSWLDANCSYCHGGGASFDLRFQAPLGDLLRWQVRDNHGVQGGALVVPGDPARSLLWARAAATEPAMRMPPLARTRADEPAVRLLGEWIRGLDAS